MMSIAAASTEEMPNAASEVIETVEACGTVGDCDDETNYFAFIVANQAITMNPNIAKLYGVIPILCKGALVHNVHDVIEHSNRNGNDDIAVVIRDIVRSAHLFGDDVTTTTLPIHMKMISMPASLTNDNHRFILNTIVDRLIDFTYEMDPKQAKIVAFNMNIQPHQQPIWDLLKTVNNTTVVPIPTSVSRRVRPLKRPANSNDNGDDDEGRSVKLSKKRVVRMRCETMKLDNDRCKLLGVFDEELGKYVCGHHNGRRGEKAFQSSTPTIPDLDFAILFDPQPNYLDGIAQVAASDSSQPNPVDQYLENLCKLSPPLPIANTGASPTSPITIIE